MSNEAENEYVPTREAKTILKVTSTQGVWNVIERAKRKHKDLMVRTRNIGTEEKPRYLINRNDLIKVAELMGKL